MAARTGREDPDAHATARRRGAAGLDARIALALGRDRQVERERGTLPHRRFHVDRAGEHSFRYAAHLREPDPAALPEFLGREPRIPDPVEVLGRNAGAAVADGDLQLASLAGETDFDR